MLFSENAKHMFRHSVHVKKEKKFCIFQNTEAHKHTWARFCLALNMHSKFKIKKKVAVIENLKQLIMV